MKHGGRRCWPTTCWAWPAPRAPRSLLHLSAPRPQPTDGNMQTWQSLCVRLAQPCAPRNRNNNKSVFPVRSRKGKGFTMRLGALLSARFLGSEPLVPVSRWTAWAPVRGEGRHCGPALAGHCDRSIHSLVGQRPPAWSGRRRRQCRRGGAWLRLIAPYGCTALAAHNPNLRHRDGLKAADIA